MVQMSNNSSERTEGCRSGLAELLSPRLFKALADPKRLSPLVRVAEGEGPNTVSHVAKGVLLIAIYRENLGGNGTKSDLENPYRKPMAHQREGPGRGDPGSPPEYPKERGCISLASRGLKQKLRINLPTFRCIPIIILRRHQMLRPNGEFALLYRSLLSP